MTQGLAPLAVIYVHPVIGRLNPVLLLASHIVASGARVAVTYPTHLDFRMEEAMSRIPEEAAGKIQLIKFKLEGEPANPREFIFAEEYKLLTTEFPSKLKEYLLDLPQPPSFFISDEVSGPVTRIALELGLRTFIFVPESALALSATLYAPKLAEQSRLPFPFDKDEAELLPPVEIPSVATLKSSQFLTPFSDLFPTWLLNTCLESAAAARSSDGFLVNSFEDLEHGTLSALKNEQQLNPRKSPVFAVGPLFPDRCLTAEHDCIEFLDHHPPASVVLVAFGSLKACSCRDEVCEILEGLKGSGYPFIWMLRCNEDWIPKKSEHGAGLIVRNWVPQMEILSHPSTGAFLSHCGWNSTLESLSRGVPILGHPGFNDQHINLKLVESYGAGMKLPRLHREEIESSLKKIMESENIRLAAQKLRNSASLADSSSDLKRFFELCTEPRLQA